MQNAILGGLRKMSSEFRTNLFMAIVTTREEFDKDPNIIGASDTPYGKKKNVGKKRFGLVEPFNMRMLGGDMGHKVFQKKEVREEVCILINEEETYETKKIGDKYYVRMKYGKWKEFKIIKEKYMLIDLEKLLGPEFKGKFLRLHSDIGTSLYTVEFKFTTMPKKMWAKLVAVYQQMQLNLYLYFNNHTWGLLIRGDLNFIKSTAKWEYIWNNYFTPYKVQFSQVLFDEAIQRIREHFWYMDNEPDMDKIPCPEHLFECIKSNGKPGCVVDLAGHCNNPIRSVDVNEASECFHCKQVIKPPMKAIMRNDKIYHKTDGNKPSKRFEECIQACKDAWEIESEDNFMIDDLIEDGDIDMEELMT